MKGWSVVFEGARWQADMVLAVLEAKGIRAESLGGAGDAIGADFNDAAVYVPEEQAQTAREVLRELDRRD